MKPFGAKLLVLVLVAVLLAALLAGCGGKSGQQQPQQQQPSSTEAKKPGKVVVGSKQFAEQYILGYMIAELLKAKTDLEVDDSLVGMGATELLHPAMLKGQLDLYPEYTGTGLMVVLKEQMISDKQAAYDKVKSEYEKQFKIIWLPPFGFEDTFAIGVRAETAQKLGLETLSDLAKRPELVFMGDETTWTRPDQYPGLQKVYGFNNKVKKTMDINLKYEALAKGEVDIIPGFSTEGNLKKYNVKVMKDDKQFFPPYDAAIVIRQETLEKYPQVGEVLKPLFGSITEADMIELNYQVEVEKKEPLEVAKSFLKKRGLI